MKRTTPGVASWIVAYALVMLVWVNGHFVQREAAMVSVFDAGFQHAVGLFETMLARNGAIFRAEQHMQRLANSARELLLSDRLRVEPLADAANLAVQRNGLSEARVRLTITGGDLSALQSKGKPAVDPTIVIVAQPPTQYPEHFFQRGVIATIAGGRVSAHDPMCGHKTLNYWPRIRALQDAAGRRGGEALWLTETDHLASGSVSNIFLVKDGVVLTPPARGEEKPSSPRAPAPVLPGITRAAILQLALDLDIEARTGPLTIDDLLAADEAFLSNSGWGVLPLVGVEREKIRSGAVGEISQRVRAAWLRLVDEETQAAAL